MQPDAFNTKRCTHHHMIRYFQQKPIQKTKNEKSNWTILTQNAARAFTGHVAAVHLVGLWCTAPRGHARGLQLSLSRGLGPLGGILIILTGQKPDISVIPQAAAFFFKKNYLDGFWLLEDKLGLTSIEPDKLWISGSP